MKLTSEPKPVRIRIKSGGEFHSTLDSLRNAFSIDDLKENENEKQFMQWCRFNWQVQNYERFLKNTSFGVKNPSFFLGLRFSFLAMFDILC